MPVHARELAIVTALATVLTAAIALPVLVAPSERIFGLELVGRHHDPFTVMAQFAQPVARGLYVQPLTDFPGAILARVIGPIPAYNAIVLLTFPLSAAAAYLLARHVALSPPAAIVAALAFAFSPFRIAQAAYHPHIVQTQWIALYFLALWRCLDRGSPGAGALLVVSAVAVTLSSFYSGLIAAVLTPVALFAGWFVKTRGTPESWRRLTLTATILLALAGAGVAYSVLAGLPIAGARDPLGFPRADLFRYSAAWWGYLTPPLAHPLLNEFAAGVWANAGVREGRLEQQVSVGWGFAALAVIAIWTWWRGQRSAQFVWVPALAGVGAGALICSLSPDGAIGALTFTGPSAALYEALPMFRAYARFGMVVQLMTVLLAAVAVQHLWTSGASLLRTACTALLVLAAAEYAVWPAAMSRDVLPTTAHRWVARQQAALRVIDCVPLTLESDSVRWLTAHRVSPRPPQDEDCTAPGAVDRLAGEGYTHALVRRGSPEAQRIRHAGLPAGMRRVERFRDAEIMALPAAPGRVSTLQWHGFHPREYLGSRSWRWMGAEASWEVINATSRPLAAAVDLEVQAFRGIRRLDLTLDGQYVQTVTVAPVRRVMRVGPLLLTPGRHRLRFASPDPITPPALADPRPLSFAFGSWLWRVEEIRP